MDHRDAEMSDIVVVVDDEQPGTAGIDAIVAKLKSMGVQVDKVDPDQGVVEGTCETGKIKQLNTIQGVKYVRSVFNYVADFPAGDPRDKDGPEKDEDLQDVR